MVDITEQHDLLLHGFSIQNKMLTEAMMVAEVPSRWPSCCTHLRTSPSKLPP